jgi:hypothetical protein
MVEIQSTEITFNLTGRHDGNARTHAHKCVELKTMTPAFPQYKTVDALKQHSHCPACQYNILLKYLTLLYVHYSIHHNAVKLVTGSPYQ